MVFETLAADLLNSFLGDFVDNLDASQLNIGIWGGDVKLNNLEIKKSALDELDLPIKLKYGFLDKLVLKIPWKNLYTEPVITNIDGLYLIAVPNTGVIYNKEKAEKMEHEIKQKELSRLEENRRNQRKPKDPASDTFTEKMIAQVIKNLQVTIKNIHIRFEDKYTNRQHPFATGLTLEGLVFQTTDENWHAAVLKDAVKIFHKLISMENLAVYWNYDSKFISDLSDKDEIRKTLHETIARENDNPEDFNYILQPITMEAKLALNQKPESDGSNWSIPKIDLNVEIKEMVLSINKFQHQGILLLSEARERFNTAARYLKYRPNLVDYRGHYREWWKFAYQCILEENVRRRKKNWSWNRMKEHRKLVRSYQNAWIQKRTEKNPGNDVQNVIEKAEKELDVFNLNIARQQSEMKIDRQGLTRLEDLPAQGWTEWAKSWWDGSATTAAESIKHDFHDIVDSDIIEKIQHEITPEEKQKLFDAIDYHENSRPIHYPKDYIESRYRLHLTTLVVMVEEAFELNVNELCAIIEKKPSERAIHLFFSSFLMGNLYETDSQLPRQKMLTELKEFVASLSYNDFIILWNLYNGVHFEQLISFEKVFFNAEQLCFSFIDEFHGASIPMLRLMFSLIKIDSHTSDQLFSSFLLSSDYFNQKRYEWQPFLMPWQIHNFKIIFKPECIRFWLKSDSTSPMKFYVTQTFIKQLKSAYSKWPVHAEDIVQEMQTSVHHYNIEGEINIPAGFGISVINNVTAEELIYAKFQGIQMNFCRVEKIYVFSGHINSLQIDNQLSKAEKRQFLHCQVNALKRGEIYCGNLFKLMPFSSDSSFSFFPAIKIEISYTPLENYDAFDCFRLKLCDISIFMDEKLLWKLVQFYEGCTFTDPKTIAITKNVQLASEAYETDVIRKCYFGTLDLEVGNIAVTVRTVPTDSLPKDLETLKRQSSIKLISFENAMVKLPPFHIYRRYYQSLEFFIDALSKFYTYELQNQTLNIFFTMDSIGMREFTSDLKETLEGVFVEGDVVKFLYSGSKVVKTMVLNSLLKLKNLFRWW